MHIYPYICVHVCAYIYVCVCVCVKYFLIDRLHKLCGGYQNRMYTCLKVNKAGWKFCVNRVGDMLERIVTTRITWASGKLYNDWRFSATGWEGNRWKSSETLRSSGRWSYGRRPRVKRQRKVWIVRDSLKSKASRIPKERRKGSLAKAL